MHWFKILLIVVMALRIVSGLYMAGKGDTKTELKAWASFVSAILAGLLLWGILSYL